MFNLVGRNLTHARHSVFKTIFIRPCSFSLSSTSSFAPNVPNYSSNQQPFRVSYLINSCGFSPEKAISASKYLTFKTPDRADSVIEFFKTQGFTETQVFDLVKKFPVVLTYNPHKSFLPKFGFLSSIGLSSHEIAKLLTACPKILGRSLKNHIEPSFNLLRDMLQSNARTLIAIKGCAWLLDRDFRIDMIPNMQLLRNVGVPGSKMLYLLTYKPRSFLTSSEDFKKTVEEVIEMGFDPSKINFMIAIHALRSMSKQTWEKKMEIYQKWGWSKDEICAAFRNNPWCMINSEEKIDKVMDFLVNKMRCDKSVLAGKMVIVSLSMEKRIVPRYLVYKYLLDNGLMENKKGLLLNWWMKCSDVQFVNKLKRFEKDAPEILKFYQEKLDHTK